MTTEDRRLHDILELIEARADTSQRVISREVGLALGLTNLLVRNLVRKGWVRAIHVKPNRVRYLLTPAGAAEKARMSRNAIRHSIAFYAETRDRIRERFRELEAELSLRGQRADPLRIVFLGAGEVAEIAYVCLQGSKMKLVGVVDDERAGEAFFGLPIVPGRRLSADSLDGMPYDVVAVMQLADTQLIEERIGSGAVSPERVFWL